MSSRRKILLVDDSLIVRAIVTHALEASGHEVVAIEDPRGLAEAVAHGEPDLVLVDATFPGITDDQLVELVIPHVALPVVLFSDRSEAEVRELVARIGARGFVPKDGATLATRLGDFF